MIDIQKECENRFKKEQEYLGTNKLINQINPLVSVTVTTYQHAAYIKDCLEGILMQKTNFPFEIIIGEDESTDGTREICIEYAEKYPDKIRLFLRNRETSQLYDENGKFVKRFNGLWTRMSARGKYIALCEGDDYWIDPYKLQKQVDFLEANPEFSLCTGGFKSYNIYTKEGTKVIIIPPEVTLKNNGYEYTLENTLDNWLTKTLTAVFRNYKELLDELSKYKYSRDVNLFYHVLKKGKGFYFTEILGVYRLHNNGIHSLKGWDERISISYKIYKELYDINKDEYSRKWFLKMTLIILNSNIHNKNNFKHIKSNFSLILDAIKLVKKRKELKQFVSVFVPKNVKKSIKKIQLSYASNKKI